MLDSFGNEFEAFPPAVKRKYFSALERLRLAQAPVSSPTFRSRGPSSVKSSNTSTNQRQSRNASHFAGTAGRRLRKSPSPANDYTQADAQWFLRLPEKVQKKHFTKEERRLLAGRGESVIVDAADEVLYRLGRQVNRSVPTLRTSSYSSESPAESLDAEEPGESLRMDNPIMDSFRWMGDDDDLDLSLDDYHAHVVKDAKPLAKTPSRRPSFRRTLSLTNMPFCGNFIPSAPRNMTPSPLPIPTMRDFHERTSRPQRTNGLQLPTTYGTINTVDPSARHYQDPEARLKLRVYLASQQKFDEVVEFGFPALENKKNTVLRRPSLSKQYKTDPSPMTFFDDDKSMVDAFDDDETASLPETVPQKTPVDSNMFLNVQRIPLAPPPSADSDDLFLKHPRHKVKPYAQILSGNREMTLRMTLTRPDLRANETVHYAKGDDPLALEQLPTMTQATDLWETPPKDGGMIRRLWRKVSGTVI